MNVYRPPEKWTAVAGVPTLFLAGSIEQGTAEEWQIALITALGERAVTVLNPRRLNWDASWRQSIDEPHFREQVEWELDALEAADVVAMWFAPGTRSPVTLLELGLVARSGKLIVGCPEGFWRKGNIEVVSTRFGIPLTTSWNAFVAALHEALDR